MRYYALLSSLPMLKPDEDAGITPEVFLDACRTYIKGKAYQTLENLQLDPELSLFPDKCLAGRYARWECALRNAVVRLRAGTAGADPKPYLNPDAEFESDAERAAAAAWNAGNPLEREKLLDRARWTKIEEMEVGQIFTYDLICGYKLKLLLQRKWTVRKTEQSARNLDLAVRAIGLAEEQKQTGDAEI